jgi:hypothetical protein
LKAERGADASVLEGAESQFDVIVDGVTVFSKRDIGRFPEPGEVARLLG